MIKKEPAPPLSKAKNYAKSSDESDAMLGGSGSDSDDEFGSMLKAKKEKKKAAKPKPAAKKPAKKTYAESDDDILDRAVRRILRRPRKRPNPRPPLRN